MHRDRALIGIVYVWNYNTHSLAHDVELKQKL